MAATIKIQSADVWVDDDEACAKAHVGQPLSADHPDILCVSCSREQDHPIPQAPPEPRPDDKIPGKMIQDPTSDPLPGKARYRLHYEPCGVNGPGV